MSKIPQLDRPDIVVRLRLLANQLEEDEDSAEIPDYLFIIFGEDNGSPWSATAVRQKKGFCQLVGALELVKHELMLEVV